MKLKRIKELFQSELKGLYEVEEIDNFFYILIEFYLGLNRLKFALSPEQLCSNEEYQPILEGLNALKKNIPIQYILGETEFYGLPFKVNPSVLIPRPETEELVQWILNNLSTSKNKLSILDIGTGSGCIAISLAKNLPNAQVFALDVSNDALKTASQNAELNHVNIEFIEASILNSKTWHPDFKNLKFDIIVSNPPYVRGLEKEQMKANVLDNEPHLALFVDDEDPLKFYKAITQLAVDNLKDEGSLFFEINEYLGNPMIQLLKEHNFYDVELKQDIFKKDRMIKGTKKA
ncbi:peptide chain release factor N(5)-glutamine methyltransferase [Gaetbulibacter sp. M235]|uniref:peptide chain release factor N(5)-glutamine methyltransferase n=1 Tax=Gaetbulibacter sp. M235 TaxID=3126510 RepID=UPI00374F4E10